MTTGHQCKQISETLPKGTVRPRFQTTFPGQHIITRRIEHVTGYKSVE